MFEVGEKVFDLTNNQRKQNQNDSKKQFSPI